jgi:hypothetical protein
MAQEQGEGEGEKVAPDSTEDYPYEEAIKAPVVKPPEQPEGPVTLRYKVDAPVRYLVRGKHRSGVRDREELRQIYTSSSVVRYRPVATGEELPRAAWMSLEGADDAPGEAGEGATRIMVEVEKAYGGFERPALLKQTERTHQILRQARLSYVLEPNGKVSDVRVHEPTSPIGRSSFEQIRTLAQSIQPVFPERAVTIGDSWTQDVVYEDKRGSVVANQNSKNTYTFTAWRPCRESLCAYITIKQGMRSAALSGGGDSRSEASSAGEGEGWMLFDPFAGQVVKTYWKLTGQGKVRVREKAQKGDAGEPVAQVEAEVVVEAEVTAERIDGAVP